MIQLPLHAQHEAHGAKFGEFAGYAMPLYYTKPLDEHHQVRQGVGVFDITHMGQFLVEGDRAEEFLDYALPNAVRDMVAGDALYSPLCKEDGGILDDLIIYRYTPAHYRIIVNASNREQDFQWLNTIAGKFDVVMKDLSEGLCLFAVQGPQAFERLRPHLGQPAESLGYYKFTDTQAFGHDVFMARTGYTGEQGIEMAVSRDVAPEIWEQLTGSLNIQPIGLAARDTLRLEACMALYGHELRAEWNPFESGVGWAVKLDKAGDFVGKDALTKIKADGNKYLLAGVEVTGRGIPREGYPVLAEGRQVGLVTSGAMSPTVGKSLAMAHVEAPWAKKGTALEVEIRGKAVEAQVVARPFYKNPHLRDQT